MDPELTSDVVEAVVGCLDALEAALVAALVETAGPVDVPFLDVGRAAVPAWPE